MAYNIPEKYQDLTPAPQLDKKTLNKMVWLSCFLQASFNYERMQACGWLWGMLPGLQKIHTNKEDLKASMAHNLDFLNTHPFLVTFVMGIVLSLEQNKADTATIRSVRISAAGPLGPRHEPKKLAFYLSEHAEEAFVGISLSYSSCIRLTRRWDKYVIPLPFTTVDVAVKDYGIVQKKAIPNLPVNADAASEEIYVAQTI